MVRNSIALFVLTFLLLPAGCKKEDRAVAENKIHGPQTLPGIWELRSLYGGYGPNGGGSFTAGNGNRWGFTDSVYHIYINGAITDSGTYKLSIGINPQTGIASDALLLNNDTLNSLYFHIANDTLTLYRGVVAADGTIDKYVRIENFLQ